MAQIDPYSLKWHNVLVEAVRFRLEPEDPADPGTILISRVVFEQLMALAEAAARADAPQPGMDELIAREKDGRHLVVINSKIFGSAQAEGRTLLEAVTKAKWEFRWAVEKRIS